MKTMVSTISNYNEENIFFFFFETVTETSIKGKRNYKRRK